MGTQPRLLAHERHQRRILWKQKRQSDLLLRIPLKGSEQAVFMVLLLEFQSSNRQWMLIRMLEYVALFYRRYILQHPAVTKLPVVFPFVLYNGAKKWEQAQDLQDVRETEPKLPQEYRLQFRYFKLAINEQDPQLLKELGNAVSTMFLAEQKLENVGEVARLLTKLLDNQDNREIVKRLVEWYKTILQEGEASSELAEKIESAIQSQEKLHTMLIQDIREQRKQDRLEGRMEGIEAGRDEGELNVMVLLLEMKFGEQAKETHERVKVLVAREGFAVIAKRIYHADSLMDVFGDTGAE